mgnify:CR=1 FL=1
MLSHEAGGTLNYRKNGIDKINRMFNTSISVERNPSYDVNTFKQNGDDNNADKELSDK